MKKVKIYGVDTWIPEDKQEQDSINAMAEVQGHALLLHFSKILRPKTRKMKRFLGKTTLVITFILLGCLTAFAQPKPKKQTGKRIQIGVVTTLAASSLTMEKMPAYMPLTGLGLFGVGFVIDLKHNKKNPKMKKR